MEMLEKFGRNFWKMFFKIDNGLFNFRIFMKTLENFEKSNKFF